jgi:outer membrane lipoprotein SlyB
MPAPAPAPTAVRGVHGVIVSRRPIEATGTGVRGTILGAVGEPAGAAGQGAAVEFIVREDDGQTVSVVQADAAGLMPGERVVLSAGGRTRLSRAAD